MNTKNIRKVSEFRKLTIAVTASHTGRSTLRSFGRLTMITDECLHDTTTNGGKGRWPDRNGP